MLQISDNEKLKDQIFDQTLLSEKYSIIESEYRSLCSANHELCDRLRSAHSQADYLRSELNAQRGSEEVLQAIAQKVTAHLQPFAADLTADRIYDHLSGFKVGPQVRTYYVHTIKKIRDKQ